MSYVHNISGTNQKIGTKTIKVGRATISKNSAELLDDGDFNGAKLIDVSTLTQFEERFDDTEYYPYP